MQGQKSFKEKRKFIRLNAKVEVKYAIIGKPGEIKVFSKDISAGGLCVIVEQQLNADTPLQLEIKMPDLKDPVRALAQVVWQKEMKAQDAGRLYYNTGIEFTGISDFDRFNINRYVIENIESEN